MFGRLGSYWTPKRVALASSSGFGVGVLAGLVGLGGAEERIPFILYGLDISLDDMVVANLIISFGTSGLNFALRASSGLLTTAGLLAAMPMVAGSLLGAYFGASLGHRLSERKLKALIVFVLSLVLIRIVFGNPAQGASMPFFEEAPVAAFFGLIIGIVAGSVGVAGGEYRIPVLMYIFGIPIKAAGTASQLVSLPTIVAGLFRHRSMGFFSRKSLQLAMVMGIPSLLGVIVSQEVLLTSTDELIRGVFGLLLLYTIVRLSTELLGQRGRAADEVQR